MKDQYSVSSPRRTLSLSKKNTKRTETDFFSDPDQKVSGFGVSGEHGPNPSEVYGFVGSISTVVATVIFFIWAYLPEPWLHSIGIDYYPSKVLTRLAQSRLYRMILTITYAGMCTTTLTSLTFRQWALAVPSFVIVTVISAMGLYIGLNFLATPPPTSLNTFFDEYTREPLSHDALDNSDDDLPIEPYSDIRIDHINDLMFNHVN